VYALTCISQRAFKELLLDGIKTLELRSAHNINSMAHVSVGEPIFITCKAEDDITRETEGIIAVVRSLALGNKRVEGPFDEYEITTARVQLERLNVAKVKDAAKPGAGKEVTVDIEQRRYYRIS
jgi:hypothetical protein